MNTYKELIVIATAASTFMSIPVLAESVQHEVQEGDTLYSISQQYSTTVDTLKELNNLDSDNLTVGDTLVVKEVEESPEEPAEPEIDTGADDAINDTESKETITTVSSTTEDGYIRDDKTFKTVSDALAYGRANFDYTIHKEFYVNYVGPNQYVLDWEMLDSYWDEEPTPEPIPEPTPDPKPEEPTPEDPEEPTQPEEGYIRDDKTFDTVDEAVDYGRSNFDYTIHKEFYVSFVGPNQYVLDWEMLDSYRDEEPETPEEPTPEEPEQPEGPETPEEGAIYYQVKAGDYLYRIANQFNITVQELKDFNNLESNLIHPGDSLIVGYAVEDEPETPEEPENPDKPETPDKPSFVYTVKHGDYLYKIATRFNVTVEQIKEWNDLDSNLLFSGDELVIHTESTTVKEPVYYTVKVGDYLYKIANLNNTTVEQLMDWNDLTHSLIYPGDVLVVGMK